MTTYWKREKMSGGMDPNLSFIPYDLGQDADICCFIRFFNSESKVACWLFALKYCPNSDGKLWPSVSVELSRSRTTGRRLTLAMCSILLHCCCLTRPGSLACSHLPGHIASIATVCRGQLLANSQSWCAVVCPASDISQCQLTDLDARVPVFPCLMSR